MPRAGRTEKSAQYPRTGKFFVIVDDASSVYCQRASAGDGMRHHPNSGGERTGVAIPTVEGKMNQKLDFKTRCYAASISQAMTDLKAPTYRQGGSRRQNSNSTSLAVRTENWEGSPTLLELVSKRLAEAERAHAVLLGKDTVGLGCRSKRLSSWCR